MYLHNRIKNNNRFFSKIKELDFVLLLCILLLGFISFVTMYSTDGGQMLFHTKSHLSKFLIFSETQAFLPSLNTVTSSQISKTSSSL